MHACELVQFISSEAGQALTDAVNLFLTDPPWNVLKDGKGSAADDRVCFPDNVTTLLCDLLIAI